MRYIIRAVVFLLAIPSFVAAQGLYTETQAKRGETAFNRYCAVCHTVDTTTPVAEQMKMGRGFRMGNRRLLSSLGERVLFRLYEGRPDYPSVWYLFNRIRKGGMPGYGAEMIGDEVKIDIAAYILQANGLPAGARELTTDAATLKQLRIPNPAVEEPDETGFVPLFNGRDFSGWKFVLGPNCRPAPDGCGRTTPSGVFKVVDGKIVCTGQTQGYMYSDKKYLNLTLRFDYRFEPLPDWDDEDGVIYYGKSGYFLFVNDHQVWPKSIQIDGHYRQPLTPVQMDTTFTYTEEPGAAQRVVRPVGQWNSVEIVAKDGKVMSYQNGVLINTITQHEFTEPGSIAFQSEGTEIHWRNIRIKVE